MLDLVWNRCKGDVWCDLFAVEIHHPHFDGMEGVYLLWHGGKKPAHVRVGQGMIGASIEACRRDPQVLAFRDDFLYVTWAKVDKASRDGVERFLAESLRPKAQGPLPSAPLIEVNLPG